MGYTIVLTQVQAQALNLFLFHIGYWPSARSALATITTLLHLDHGNIADTEGVTITLNQTQATTLIEAFDSFLPRVKKGETDGHRAETCQAITGIYQTLDTTHTRELCICLG